MNELDFGVELNYSTFCVGCNTLEFSVIQSHIYMIYFQSGFVIDIDASVRDTSGQVFRSF